MILIFSILGFAAWAAVSTWGLAGLNNAGPHGLSEILYAYSSATGNNGSAFAGLNGNTSWYNTTLGLGHAFWTIRHDCAGAGSGRKPGEEKTDSRNVAGAFPYRGLTFTLVLVGTVLIVGALTFFPALALGPIVEHFLMTGSNILY